MCLISKYNNKKFLEKYKEKVKEEHRISFYKEIIRILGDVGGKEILDLGCGPRILTNQLAELGAKSYGLDISKEWVNYCKENYNQENLKFVFGKGEKLNQFKNNSLDTRIINMVLLNVPILSRVEKIFKEVRRTLKSKGTLVFSDLNIGGIIESKMTSSAD